MAVVNGQEYQHALVRLELAEAGAENRVALRSDTPIFRSRSFTELSYSDGVPKELIPDAQGNIVGFKTGRRSIDAAITMLLSEWFRLKEHFGRNAPQLGIGQRQFTTVVTYGNDSVNYQTDYLIGVMFQREPRESHNDQGALYIKLPLFVFDINPQARFVNY